MTTSVEVLVLVASTYLGPNRRALPPSEEGDIIKIYGGKYATDLIENGFLALANNISIEPEVLGQDEDQPRDIDREVSVTVEPPPLAEQAEGSRARRRRGM